MHRTFQVVAALCLAAAAAYADTVTVYVFNREFSQNMPGGPQPLPHDPVIQVGDTVHWVVTDGFHTVTSCANQTQSFDSDFIMPGDTFDHTFTQPGTFGYYCVFHGFDNGNGTAGGMAGVVTVEAAPPVCAADLGVQGGTAGQDGVLDNNDFVVFID
ncbi:MAG TPA: hypothetical protein VEB22_09510, partial [Phycisphaerales bacterium]|nr:hypothetical protein [Phycisphaerales bacterium]